MNCARKWGDHERSRPRRKAHGALAGVGREEASGNTCKSISSASSAVDSPQVSHPHLAVGWALSPSVSCDSGRESPTVDQANKHDRIERQGRSSYNPCFAMATRFVNSRDVRALEATEVPRWNRGTSLWAYVPEWDDAPGEPMWLRIAGSKRSPRGSSARRTVHVRCSRRSDLKSAPAQTDVHIATRAANGEPRVGRISDGYMERSPVARSA